MGCSRDRWESDQVFVFQNLYESPIFAAPKEVR
jgi:hypothetical protein